MPPRRPRRHVVDLGNFRAIKLGMPTAASDVYYATMEMSWPAFVGFVSLAFLLINLAFGTLYALLPGAIGNMAPGSLVDGFFFSVETLGTVGYGNMAPSSHLGHSIAAVEILIGLFYSATITGLIFARFARPRASFAFSRNALIREEAGRRLLILRVASMRLRPIVDVTAQLSFLERIDRPDGRRYRQLVELPLLRPHNPQLAFSWTLAHEIADDSSMLAALLGDGEFRLTVAIAGVDTLLASQALGGQVYNRADILFDHDFVDMIDDSAEVFEFDLAKLHRVAPSQPAMKS